MNLDELQSVQARERQSSDLQHLRSSFYREVGEFINELNEERARVVEAADDPFAEPDVRRLTDDIETAEATVEAIYERRVGKVVKKASIAAAGMPVENEGLTDEEQTLFDDLVDRIESNRDSVLSVLDGKAPSVSCSIDEEIDAKNTGVNESAEPEPMAASDGTTEAANGSEDGVSAADLMGDGAETAAARSDDHENGPSVEATPNAEPGSEAKPEVENEPKATPKPPSDSQSRSDPQPRETEPEAAPTASGSTSETEAVERPPGTATEPDPTTETGSVSRARTESRSSDRTPGMPRTTVRITADIGEIVGADGRDYNLGDEDVVTLPNPNADTLVDKDAAERLE